MESLLNKSICHKRLSYHAFQSISCWGGVKTQIYTNSQRRLYVHLQIVIAVINSGYGSLPPQNIHLVAKWLAKLEKKLETYSEGSHAAYRVYMSAEPAPTPDSHIIPQVNTRENLFVCLQQCLCFKVLYSCAAGVWCIHLCVHVLAGYP